MTKVIEILVIGDTGSGKSHVLELIDKALRDGYGPHVQITSHDLSLERGLGSPGEKPRVSDTIFNLRERGTASGGGQSSGSLKVEVDTSAIDSALEKIEALGKDYWLRKISSGTASVEAVQGFTTGYAIDPLESAIELIVRMMDERMASDRSPSLNVGVMLMGHLEELLAEQLRRVTDPDRDATLVSHLNGITRKLQSLIDVKASTVP